MRTSITPAFAAFLYVLVLCDRRTRKDSTSTLLEPLIPFVEFAQHLDTELVIETGDTVTFVTLIDALQAMDCSLRGNSLSHNVYAQWVRQTAYLNRGSSQLPALVEGNDESDPELTQPTRDPSVFAACRRCRYVLVYENEVIWHAKANAAEKGHGKSISSANSTPSWQLSLQEGSGGLVGLRPSNFCHSLFITVPDVERVSGALESPSGKLHCPHCQSKIGSFAWYGANCDCGKWVTPAFQISISKVDLKQIPV